ncbi:MAG: exodeoxyribonuclease VII large subunit [Amoebophilaceae bacterium TMED152]|nr:exodeoxyribonuclease VII large subunit [Gammaproteobacteria bacterium]RPH01631.1 MAG: exodeoxyribonuclease VII large subunit [Amoebophilaceae bacterium TMED152]|tara:strand:+ start:19 stop:1242 length:1224 start_codon:yes stop_codon:yes gene_type:complete
MEDYSDQTISDQREILSVSEVNQTANDFLNEAFPPLWVVGEISNFREYGTSGHWYFSIKDPGSVLNCTMFRLQNINLRFKPKEGDQVILQGKLSIYKKTGRYQMIASKMELAGFGELMRRYEQLKNKLSTEGLFEKKNVEQVPEIINRVAVVTSAHGAAIKDVISTLQRRSPHVEVLVAPTKVQGDGSAESIQESLNKISNYHKRNTVDVVILCRGGGSIEDLWSFNDEMLCRYLADYDIPVISGVGHETDFTLTDFIANVRAATPTAAAEIVSEGASKLNEYFKFLNQSLIKEVKQKINQMSERLITLQRLLRSPKQRLQEQYLRLDSNLLELNAKIGALLAKKANSFKVLKEKLSVINPEQILGRGYSITFTSDGKIVSDAKLLKKDDLLETRLAKGKLKSKVIS